MSNRILQSFLVAALFLLVSSLSFAEAQTGTWTKKFKKIHGSWTIEQRQDGAYLVLGDDFKTRNAPDLKFVLSNQSLSDVNGDNAMQGALVIEDLKSNKGAQEYKLPENFGDYTTLLLHCEKFSKLWGGTDI